MIQPVEIVIRQFYVLKMPGKPEEYLPRFSKILLHKFISIWHCKEEVDQACTPGCQCEEKVYPPCRGEECLAPTLNRVAQDDVGQGSG